MSKRPDDSPQVHRIYSEQAPPGQSGGCLRAIAVPAMGVSLVASLLLRAFGQAEKRP